MISSKLRSFSIWAISFSAIGLAIPQLALAETDAELDDALARHFDNAEKQAPMPGSELPAKAHPTADADAMVSHLTQDIPADLTVAARRPYVDLDIKFDFDSSDLSADGTRQLDTAGQALNDPRLQSRRFMLGGHTDDRGDPAYNRELSQKRAESARKYLIEKHGVSPDRLETAGFGSDHPKDRAKTTAARKHNRRVVLEMIE